MTGSHLVVQVEAHEAVGAGGCELAQVPQILHRHPVELLHLHRCNSAGFTKAIMKCRRFSTDTLLNCAACLKLISMHGGATAEARRSSDSELATQEVPLLQCCKSLLVISLWTQKCCCQYKHLDVEEVLVP